MFVTMNMMIAIGIIVLVILIIAVVMARRCNRKNELDRSHSESDVESRFETETGNAGIVNDHPVEVQAPVEIAKQDGPILRCYDYFEFPKEGGFQVKTCGVPVGPSTKKLFLQWFPIENTSQYNIYCSSGRDVSPSKHDHKWTVSGVNYYFESESLLGDGCWSAIVTAVNKNGAESHPSAIYSTCV